MNRSTWHSMAILTGALLMTRDIGALTEAGAMTAAGSGEHLSISTNTIQVLHRTVTVDGAFEPFTTALEKILGHFPEGVQQDIIAQPQRAKERLKAAEGAQELMISLGVRSRCGAQHGRCAKKCEAVPDWQPFNRDSDEPA